MKRIVYREFAATVDALHRCQQWWADPTKAPALADRDHWRNRVAMHKDRLRTLTNNHMPSGSGIDSGCEFDDEQSSGEKLVFTTSYHHMDESGGYDGWTDHKVTVKPSLIHGITIDIGGRNRNDIKEYLTQTFDEALNAEFDE